VEGIAVKKIIAFSLIGVFLLSIGCGVKNITNRGEFIDRKSIPAGTPRKVLLGRFGRPVDTQKAPDGTEVDTFRVQQGETTEGKVAKAGGVLVLDILTFGLAEFVATPVTKKNYYIIFEVAYDRGEKVRDVRFLSGP
jgi:hypothetical protein